MAKAATVLAAALLAVVVMSAPGSAAPEIIFTILHTGDEHSALIPHSPAVDYHPGGDDGTVGGFARMAGLISLIRDELDGPSLLLSSGDFIGGTMFSWLALDCHAPELALMAEMGYDAIAIGNHEFDYGPDVLADYLAVAGYPDSDLPVLLGGNMEIPSRHALARSGIQRSTLIELPGGLMVGLFSLLGEDAVRVTAETGPVTFSDGHEAARALVGELRDLGADVIVAVTHSGVAEDVELARDVEGIDVIVGGHCHTALANPVVEGNTIIVQAGPHLEHLGVLDLAYDPATGAVRVRNTETGRRFLYPVDGSSPTDPVIDGMVGEYRTRVNAVLSRVTGGDYSDILDPVARSRFTVPRARHAESALGNLVADGMRWTARDLGYPADLAFQANGQIRADLVPGRAPGTEELLSVYDVAMAASLGYGPGGEPGCPLVMMYLTGDEVRRVLEISALLSGLMGDSYFLQVSGLTYTYDASRAMLMWLPILDVPVPTYRAVLSAHLEDGTELGWGDETLYAVVSDVYVVNMVPMVGDLLPRLAIVPKDEHGNPVEVLEDRIISDDGRQVPVWGSLLRYLGSMEPGADGLPVVESGYAAPDGRGTAVKTFPLTVWVGLAAALVVAGITALVVGLVRRRRAARGPRPRREREAGID